VLEADLYMDILSKLGKTGIVPVVVLEDSRQALPLAEALLKGGIDCAEVTFRTDAAEESIKLISEKYPEMLVGAGTVLSVAQADKAINAGAKFIVSPGHNPEVSGHVRRCGIDMVPGVLTPSEIEAALALGFKTLKIFPAEPSGGAKYIKAISAPYRNVKFMPTGGINADNFRDYLKLGSVLACGGSWMVSGKLVASGNFEEITRLSAQARAIVKEVRGE